MERVISAFEHVPTPTKASQVCTQTVTVGRPLTPPHDEVFEVHTINDVLLERCRTVPDVPLVGYPTTADTAEDYTFYTAKDLHNFASGAVSDLLRQGFEQPSQDSEVVKTVAILGPTNLEYIATIFALSRLGCAVLFLSTRLSTEAAVNLLKKTDCHDVLFCDVTRKAVEKIGAEYTISTFKLPAREAFIDYKNSEDLSSNSTAEHSSRTAFIIHSSGSTGLPKPIFQTHKACISNYSVSKGYEAFLTLPLYHNHGLSTFFRSIFKAKPIAIYNAKLPLTGGNLLRSLRSVKPESFHCVPYALKLLTETDGGVEELAKTKQVLFGGSSCPDEIGDKLVQGGVRVISHYGATEMGQLMTSERDAGDLAWNYVRPFPNTAPFLFFDKLNDGSYECVVLEGLPAKVASNSDNPANSFRTSDCFLKHPSIPNAWKYLGRIDDRVTLMNGEKVLPIPIEHRVRQNKFVKDVLVIGVGKLLPGMIIVASDEAAELDDAAVLSAVWPDIQAANANAEAFSQISRSMVRILDRNVSYPQTDKGTMIRAACYRQFAELIESVFETEPVTAEQSQAGKLILDSAEIEAFLMNLLTNEMQSQDITADTDFFAAGMDSLQAIKAHGIVKQRLDLGGKSLGQNAFFDFGTPRKLAGHLYSLRTGKEIVEESEIDVMDELVKKYSNFQTPAPIQEDVVVLTGVTGSLGPYVLSKLLQKSTVSRIYCLVRASSADTALDRVVSTLTSRELPVDNISKIRALPSDFSQANLGLDAATISAFRMTVTKVIHSAWAVNFNIGVRSFEQQHIRGVHNLINLCLSSQRGAPAEFYFCSSISAAAGTPLPAVIQEGPIPELAHAQNMGYARSKLVAEKIVEAAAVKTGMVAKVLRIGQIVGDTVTGRWNPVEAIPLMIQSAVTMKALPALDETPSWTPVDIVAQAVLELTGIDEAGAATFAQDSATTYHLQNSKLFHWTHDLLPALRAAGLEFETIPQREWVKRLREGERDPKKNPTVKLVDFYADKYDNDRPGRKGLVFKTEKTEQASPSLRGGVELIESDLIRKYVASWLKSWPAQST